MQLIKKKTRENFMLLINLNKHRKRIYIADFNYSRDAKAFKKSSGWLNKITPSLDRRIGEKQRDSSLTWNRIKANTNAECSPRTIRWYLYKKGFTNVKRLQRPRHKISRLQLASAYQTWDVDKWQKAFSDEKNSTLRQFSVLLTCKR